MPSFYRLTYHIYTGSVELAVAKFLWFNLPYLHVGSVELAVAKFLWVNLLYLHRICGACCCQVSTYHIYMWDLWSLLLPSFYGLTYHIYTGSQELAVAKFLCVNLPYLHRICGACCCQVSMG